MSCTPSADTATKKRRTSFCCSGTPPDQYLNNPVVTVPNTSGGTSDIPAAMQPWQYCGYGPTGGCGLPSNWRDFCGNAYDGTNADAAIPCGTSIGPSVEGRNVFTLNPDYVWKKRCQLPGWKAVAALRYWPGRFGFLTSPECCPNAQTQTKYLSVSREFSITVSNSGHYEDDASNTEDFTGQSVVSETYTGSVDTYGNRSSSAIGQSSTDFDDKKVNGSDGSLTEIKSTLRDDCGTDGYYDSGGGSQIVINGFQTYAGTYDFNLNNVELLSKAVTITVTCGNIDIKVAGIFGSYFNGTADQLNAQQFLAFNAAYENIDTTTHKLTYTPIDIVPLRVITLSDTEIYLTASGGMKVEEYYYNLDGTVQKHSTQQSSWNFTYRLKVTTPFTWQQVQDDCKLLLDTWNMGDPEIYPWRQDGKVWLLPLVTRDSTGASPDGIIPACKDTWGTVIDSGSFPDGSGTYTYTTGNRAAVAREFSESLYTGKIVGAPQPIRYGRWFNFRQKVVCAVCSSDIVIQDNNWFCTSGWGQLSYDPLPETATQWTDAEIGSLLTEGNYCIQYNESCLMSKSAETLMEWPSVNLARPFGRDRFLIDFADPALTDDPACAGTQGIAYGTFTSDIVTDPASFLYAHRKFPNCRAIGSALGIASATDNRDGTVTLTTSETHWLCGDGDGHGYTDKLDFYNVPGLGTGVTVKTATPGSNTFVVDGSLTGSYSSGGHVASAGMTADLAKWDWTCSRHQFCVQEWDVNPRQYGGWDGTNFTTPIYKYTETQVTLTPKTGYSVAICSPNNDTFPDDNAVYRAPWRDITYEACSVYWSSAAMGNKHHTKFLQAVVDPFFISPVKCSGDGAGSSFSTSPFCWDDTSTLHYALVEPMTQLPAGAPVPPVTIPFTHDTGVPQKVAVACSFPADRTPTLAMFNATYKVCAEPGWREATHDTCPANNFALPLASGYVPPTTGTTPPEAQATTDGAGSTTGGAGDTVQPGAGDSNSGGLI